MKKVSLSLSALALVTLASGAALACGDDEGGKEKHHAMKEVRERLERDGQVALSELPAKAQKHLARADANKDGKLTKEEFELGVKARIDDRFAKADKNSDGVITADEAGRKWKHIGRADQNQDGKVTKEELRAARDVRHAGRGHRG